MAIRAAGAAKRTRIITAPARLSRLPRLLAIYHQRYSTNTFPTWPLSQPFRMLAHNGEINTRRGNVNWMHAREAELQADFWGEDIDQLKPIIQPGGSDSSDLDNAVEVCAKAVHEVAASRGLA